MDERSWHILKHLIDEYVVTAKPVSSDSIKQQWPHRSLSSATIRAVMADLLEGGYLSKAHHSSGSIPTEQGLRTFVNRLDHVSVRPSDRRRLSRITEGSRTMGAILSKLSGQMAVVSVPKFLGSVCRELGLVRCSVGCFLAYIVSSKGEVQHTLVHMNFDLEPIELQRVENYLNAKVSGKSFLRARMDIQEDLRQNKINYQYWQRHALEIGDKTLANNGQEITVDGASRLACQPEFADNTRLKTLLAAIEDKTAVLALMDKVVTSQGVHVSLGSEHCMPEVAELACVGSSASDTAGNTTAVSLIGPMRMDYRRWMPLMRLANDMVIAHLHHRSF